MAFANGSENSGESGGGNGPFLWPNDVKILCPATTWKKTEYLHENGKVVGTFITQNGIVTSTYEGQYSSVVINLSSMIIKRFRH